MFISKDACRIRQIEAQNARNNRAEITKALSVGEVTRRDLFKWGIFTVGGSLALKNGLSQFATSAYATVPTGTPRSPVFGATKFSQPLNRLRVQKPRTIYRSVEGHAIFDESEGPNERPGHRLSYHTDFSEDPTNSEFINPRTGRGPIEGRPPGELFAHQRWEEYFPKVGYVMSLAEMASYCKYHPRMAPQTANKSWCMGAGNTSYGEMPPFLVKARYGEPMLMRIYNNLPVDRADNGGFGRNETQMHFHNAHNGAESDGAANVHHYPGTFYDYRWSTTLARADKINKFATDPRASGPDGDGGLTYVPGDWRELQGTMWAHDHRFFFTAENVYKGNFGAVTYYSGRDRGNELLDDGINLMLPSGSQLDWGNLDFDVNLMFHDCCTDVDGQLFYDIFDTEGMLGDLMMVNGTYAPFLEVLPRKYRFRIQNACVSRFIKLALAGPTGSAVPIKLISNDGNLLVVPQTITALDVQGMAERFDFVVDFSKFRIGDRLKLVNCVEHKDGKKSNAVIGLATAIKGTDALDPCVGPVMEFRVVGQVNSVDVDGVVNRATDFDRSVVAVLLTEQIPIVAPTRTRTVEFGLFGDGNSRGSNGKCIPDCPEFATFPWNIKIDGKSSNSLNANRVSLVIPKPGEVEHWTYINGGSGWDHPIHLHFEEGVTLNRGGAAMGPGELYARKDVWRLRPSGKVQFQIQFGEYGGAYVNHCHNTVHEDFAMLARLQIFNGIAGSPQAGITPTPNPTPDGVVFLTPEVLPEAYGK
jgi:FtsP/CotA-like multicopper oxidase with cupredoxin domain